MNLSPTGSYFNSHSVGTATLYRVSLMMRSKSCCISTSIPVDPATLFPSVVYRAALSIPPSSSCKLKRKSLAVSERGRRVNWQVSFREGSGTLTTGRPFWTWIEARTRQLGRRDREGKQGGVRWKEWKGEERRGSSRRLKMVINILDTPGPPHDIIKCQRNKRGMTQLYNKQVNWDNAL